MGITAAQCRAARGLLNWSQRELVERSGVSQKAIADFERGVSTPYMRTLKDIIAAFEAGGVQFIAAQEPATGIGVAFRWGIQAGNASSEGADRGEGAPGEGLDARAWDEDFHDAAPATHDPDFPPLEISDQDREDLREMLRTVEISPQGRAVLIRDFRL